MWNDRKIHCVSSILFMSLFYLALMLKGGVLALQETLACVRG